MISTECADCIKKATIGVLVTRKQRVLIKKDTSDNRLGRLAKANKKAKATLYFFSIWDVNMEALTINGVYYDNENGLWLSKIFPFPQVLYNRGGVSTSQKIKYESFRRELARQRVKYINCIKGFNKWEVYQNLKQVKDIQPHLPITRRFKKNKDLMDMLKRHDKLYLKACRGRKGYQVFRVTKLGKDRYEYCYFTMEDRVRLRKVNLRGLLRAIHDFFLNKDFIIQQAINLPKIDDKIVDIRSEAQRNGKGELEFTSICVRLGQKHSPITTHADSYRFEDFYRDFMNYSEEEIIALRKTVEIFLTNVYRGMEHFYGPMGEIGIDFGMGEDNHIWLIECNSMPAKVSLMKAYDEETVERAFLNPLVYANYLVNIENEKKEMEE